MVWKKIPKKNLFGGYLKNGVWKLKMFKLKTNPYFWTSKFDHYIFGTWILKFYKYKCLFIQIDNLNLIMVFAYCWFNGMLIIYKCVKLYKNLHYDTKKWTFLPCNHLSPIHYQFTTYLRQPIRTYTCLPTFYQLMWSILLAHLPTIMFYKLVTN